MKANSDKSKQSNKATRRVLAGVLCGASVLSLVLSLVMPPISQAITNDAQTVSTEGTVTGGGSSSESTDVGNTNNGDTENQISDDAEGGESGDDAQLEGQSEEGQQNEGTTTSDGETVVTAAENEQAKTAAEDIASATELRDKLQGVLEGQTASFKLTEDIVCNDEIFLNRSNSNITLKLNGCKIKHSINDKPLFSVSNGAEFTITDFNPGEDNNPGEDKIVGSQPLQNQDQTFTSENYGKNGKVDGYDNDDIPTTLTYYVTRSSASGTSTAETLETHTVNIKGAIVSTAPTGSALRLINVYNHGKFNLLGGTLTQKKDCNVGSLIYAENGSTVNMSGGYVCGATSRSQGAGIELKDEGTTLDLTGGVIAGNYAPNGGGVYSNGSSVSISKNAVISGNATLNGESDQPGYGGGIMARGGSVAVSGGYITNNRMSKFCGTDGSGNHGGGGLAADYGAKVTISGGQITGNYSEEAGGGVYVTDQWRDGSRKEMTWLNITGGIIASNVSYRSEGAGIRVGQKVDAMIGDTPDNNGTPGSKVYITNNCCMSRFDWGGGGIFVQGDSKNAVNAGRLFVYNSYISSNTAGGYGGGVAVCPTGKTLVTNTKGTAIFGNSSARDEHDWKNDYNTEYNSGNNDTPHLSGGGIGDTNKTEDRDAYDSLTFRESGHADFFLAARDHNTPVAVVSGKMLGDIDAKYSGSIELKNRISIPANGVAQVKNSIGLTSDVRATDKAVTDLVQGTKVTTFITGNYSWDHGGGIMSNGDLYLGVPEDTYVYPSLKLKATKALKNQQTNQNMKFDKDKFSFSVYRKDSDDATEPFWNDKKFNNGGCTLVGTAKNDANGNITFDLGEQLIDKTVKANEITYYLVENAGNDPGITYDPDITYDSAVYKIVVTVQDNQTSLMNVPSREDPNLDVTLYVHNYTIRSVSLGDSTNSLEKNEQGYYSIVDPDGGKTFTNKYTPYSSNGSWTPKATKVVVGGEMKEFTLQLAKDSRFRDEDIVGTAVTSGDKKKQTLPFVFDKGIAYTLSDITKGPYTAGDSTGRGASKTFTYYMREKDDSSIFSHYKFDHSVYKLDVTMADQKNGKIVPAKVTYRKGTVDSDGKWNADPHAKEQDLTDKSIPTFTNTYSTSLPLSGMSGVTLTYLAGAAVLCAAAAWMHIRRKANAKGGERRE
ncbi:hypothetical protein DWY05_07115 [Collinsella sp. AF23-4AC]|uniref:Spy0128 family protein n=1 Tax=Collinsella sp. AF23-4AC TaxID=2292224 RepID=UPI000E4CBDC2|nr:FctA domain-containing protein [Collinsella sp. AF23-4AC]RGS22265.1 hypothetical protein DWY05_07115 [Collinsella sp. AF23-4AC]